MRSTASLDSLVASVFRQGPSAYEQPPFSSVEHGLAAIEADGPEHLAADALREDLKWFASMQRALEAISARWLAELDRRPLLDRGDPCHLWLQDTFKLTSNAAYAQVRTARQLEELPRTADALRRGELGAQHVSVICRAMEEQRKTSLDRSDTEAELIGAAIDMDPQQLLRHWFQLRYRADQEAGVAAEQAQRRRRWLSLTRRWDGGYRLEGELDAEGGETLKTALEALSRRRSRDDDRTAWERRADGLVELARCRLDAGDLPERGGERPHLAVVADLATLRLEPGSRLAQLDWGPLVTGETARRIGCDANVTPVLMDGNGKILHVGRRTRTVSPRMRRALNLRDGRCQGPGCHVAPEDCTPHHIRHWADGGPTDLSNLELLCSVCHARRHPENDRFRGAP